MKRGYTFVEILVALTILATLAGLLVPAVMCEVARHASTECQTPEPWESWALQTEKHDGHWFVRDVSRGYFVHHPDCPCHTRQSEAD